MVEVKKNEGVFCENENGRVHIVVHGIIKTNCGPVAVDVEDWLPQNSSIARALCHTKDVRTAFSLLFPGIPVNTVISVRKVAWSIYKITVNVKNKFTKILAPVSTLKYRTYTLPYREGLYTVKVPLKPSWKGDVITPISVHELPGDVIVKEQYKGLNINGYRRLMSDAEERSITYEYSNGSVKIVPMPTGEKIAKIYFKGRFVETIPLEKARAVLRFDNDEQFEAFVSML